LIFSFSFLNMMLRDKKHKEGQKASRRCS
jgi:hypothetical protein